jgi:Icc protein
MINKWKALCLFLMLCATLVGSLYAQEGFRFVFMADVHYHDKNDAPLAMDAAIDTINKLKPDLILVGGDMVYDALRRTQGAAEEQATLFLEKVAKLDAPVYYAIGNHDHFALYDKKTATDHPLFGKRFFEKYFGPRYYSFDHKGWHFITLDDMVVTEERSYVGRIDSLQLAWLREDLEQVADSTPVVIMAHIPVITTLSQWNAGGTRANDNKLAIENGRELLALCKKKNLRLILQGHIHYYEVLHILNKTTVISTPSFSGKWWMGKMNEMDKGFVVIDVKGDQIVDYFVVEY